jgi:AraC-like DNA-binding protein
VTTIPTRGGDISRVAQPNSWFRTRSPEQAIQRCSVSFYPHRLELLGRAHNFELIERVTRMGPITLGDIIFATDVRITFDESRLCYHVCVPLRDWVQTRYRGKELTSTPALGSIYRPDEQIMVTRWPGGSRHLQVKIDQLAVDRALQTLLVDALDAPVAFGAALPLQAGAAQDWVRLLLMVHRQLECPDNLLQHSLVWDPLVESLIHGLLLMTEHPYRQTLAAPVAPGRPGAVRDAMDLIESGPHLPLTTSTLASQCHVSVRTLQEGFRRHLGMSPMAYLRVVRLQRAHRDLRSADPDHSTVAGIAHRWGFTHLGRFAAAHKEMFGETPQHVLRAAL